jgi:hypothetical protein
LLRALSGLVNGLMRVGNWVMSRPYRAKFML